MVFTFVYHRCYIRMRGGFPKELWELRGPIFGNAILLVFITTIVGGF